MKLKLCPKCQSHRDIVKFGIDKSRKDGTSYYCRDCIRKASTEYRKKNPQVAKRYYTAHKSKFLSYYRQRKFGLNEEAYQSRLKAQHNVCAICKKLCTSGRSLAVDHDHKTKQIRGLLCGNCNKGLGCFQDSIQNLQEAILYLDNANAITVT